MIVETMIVGGVLYGTFKAGKLAKYAVGLTVGTREFKRFMAKRFGGLDLDGDDVTIAPLGTADDRGAQFVMTYDELGRLMADTGLDNTSAEYKRWVRWLEENDRRVK